MRGAWDRNLKEGPNREVTISERSSGHPHPVLGSGAVGTVQGEHDGLEERAIRMKAS